MTDGRAFIKVWTLERRSGEGEDALLKRSNEKDTGGLYAGAFRVAQEEPLNCQLSGRPICRRLQAAKEVSAEEDRCEKDALTRGGTVGLSFSHQRALGRCS